MRCQSRSGQTNCNSVSRAGHASRRANALAGGAAAAAAVLVVAGVTQYSAAATILVDEFSSTDPTRSPAFPQSVNTDTNVLVGDDETGLSNVLGAVRGSQLGDGSMDVDGFDEARITVFTGGGNSFFDYTASVGADARVVLGYGSAAGSGTPLNVNATGQTALRLELLAYDAPAGQSLLISGSINSGAGSFSLTPTAVLTPGAQFVDIPLATLPPGVLADVDGIGLDFNPPRGGDFRIERVSLVPEPGTFTLVTLPVVAAAAMRRRKR